MPCPRPVAVDPRPTSFLRCLGALAALWASGACSAGEAALATNGLARVVTDYLYRGYSKSDDRPSLQLHGGMTAGNGLYAGMWVNRVQLGTARWEGMPYLGWRRGLGADWQVEGTIAGYVYDDDLDASAGHYGEVYASVHYQDWLSARVSHAVDAYGFEGDAQDIDLKLRYPLSDVLQASASLGHAWFDEVAGYDVTHYSVGVARSLSSRITAELRWHGAFVGSERVTAPGHDFFERLLIDNRLAASISLSF